jgi:ATP-binding cassette subfamily F protein uup
MFADYSQWEAWLQEREVSSKSEARPTQSGGGAETVRASGKKKLSYLEAREYETIEQRVAAAEEALQSKREQLEDPAIASDGPRLLSAHGELEVAQDKVDELYARWAELEKKKN